MKMGLVYKDYRLNFKRSKNVGRKIVSVGIPALAADFATLTAAKAYVDNLPFGELAANDAEFTAPVPPTPEHISGEGEQDQAAA